MFTQLLSSIIYFLSIAIFARIIMDWLVVAGVMRYDGPLRPIRDALIYITEPILAPIRRYARIGMIDLSPMIAIIVLSVIGQIVASL